MNDEPFWVLHYWDGQGVEACVNFGNQYNLEEGIKLVRANGWKYSAWRAELDERDNLQLKAWPDA